MTALEHLPAVRRQRGHGRSAEGSARLAGQSVDAVGSAGRADDAVAAGSVCPATRSLNARLALCARVGDERARDKALTDDFRQVGARDTSRRARRVLDAAAAQQQHHCPHQVAHPIEAKR